MLTVLTTLSDRAAKSTSVAFFLTSNTQTTCSSSFVEEAKAATQPGRMATRSASCAAYFYVFGVVVLPPTIMRSFNRPVM